MDIEERIRAFGKLGQKIGNLTMEEVHSYADQAKVRNGWFTTKSVKNALDGISFMLHEKKLEKWLSNYSFKVEVPKVVGIIMTGKYSACWLS